MDPDERAEFDPNQPKVAGQPSEERVIILCRLPGTTRVTSVRFDRKYAFQLALDLLDMADRVAP